MTKPNLRDLDMLLHAQTLSGEGLYALVTHGQGAAFRRLARLGLVTQGPMEFTITKRGSAVIDEMLKLLTPEAIDAMEERDGTDD